MDRDQYKHLMSDAQHEKNRIREAEVMNEKEFEDEMEHTAWLNSLDRGVGSEIHLDSDEWGEILYTLQCQRDAADGPHRTYLESICLKLEAAGIRPNN